jgi:hypothetical protein
VKLVLKHSSIDLSFMTNCVFWFCFMFCSIY